MHVISAIDVYIILCTLVIIVIKKVKEDKVYLYALYSFITAYMEVNTYPLCKCRFREKGTGRVLIHFQKGRY